MSHTRNTAEDKSNSPSDAYLQLSQMLREGRSWSGRERNTCFLNTRDGRFATVSAVSGFDFPDDARAVAIADWDQDGDEDLWVSNRNAPRLRFLRNDAASGGHFIAVRLAGNGTTTNRDAIGARVEAHVTGGGPSPRIKTLRAGEGFLAQSSKWLHFGLGAATRVEKVVVRWPGGAAETFAGLELDRRYRLEQGSSKAEGVSRRQAGIALKPSEPSLPHESGAARIPLATLLTMPKLTYQGFDGSARPIAMGAGKPVLINLWASWCAPCVAELKELAAAQEALRGGGLDVVALAVDGLGDDRSDPETAAHLALELKLPFASGRATGDVVQLLQHVHDSLVPLHRPLPVPTSFLVDGAGRLSVIYKGAVTASVPLKDLAHSSGNRIERWLRSAPVAGRAIEDEEVERSAKLVEVQTRFLFALELAGSGRLDDALAAYREVLALKPDFPEAHNNLGLALLTKGDLAGAQEHYLDALGIRPDMAQAHYNLGALLDRRGDLAGAEVKYGEALRLKPDYAEANSALGLVYAKQGRMGEAKSRFEREIAINPSFGDAHNNLGLVLLGQGQEAAAGERFREAIRLKPGHADAHNNLGVVLKRQGKLDEAALEYEEAVRLQPGFAEAHNNLGLALLSQGKPREAEMHFARALEIQPDFAAARKNLERVRSQNQGN